MDANTLDGTYQVSSTSSYDGPVARKSDGVTVIRDGQTARTDASGIVWNSRFTVLSENEVEMVSVADPSGADVESALLRPDGSPTLESVTYRAVLKLARKGERVQMSGQIQYGDEIVLLTLRRTGD